MTQELDQNHRIHGRNIQIELSASHGRPQKFFQGGATSKFFFILYRLLTMQCTWTFTKRFTLSTKLVCAG